MEEEGDTATGEEYNQKSREETIKQWKGKPNKGITGRERTGSESSILEFLHKRKRESEEGSEETLKRRNSIRERERREEDRHGKSQEQQPPEGKAEMSEEKLAEMSDREILMMLTKQMADIQKNMRSEKEELKEDMRKLKEELGEHKKRQEQREKEREDRFYIKLGYIEKKIDKMPKDEEVRNLIKRLETVEKKITEKKTTTDKEDTIGLGMQTERVERAIWILEKREKEERKKNLIIKGWIPESTNGLNKNVDRFFKEKIGVEVEIESARIIGKRNYILVRMRSEEEKEKIMNNKKLLGKEEIYIGHDRTMLEREIQRKVLEKAKEEKSKNKEVIIKYWKLRIDGTWYKWIEKEGKLKKQVFRENLVKTQ